MKVIIISDSHLNRNILEVIHERHSQESELFIHCGDSQLMATDEVLKKYKTVRGNCDMDISIPLTQTITVTPKHTMYVTHGHLCDVKYSIHRLHYKALEANANIVCFGHSHEISCELIDGILYLNPGSVLLPRNTREKTYVQLELDETNQAQVIFLEAETGKHLGSYTFNL